MHSQRYGHARFAPVGSSKDYTGRGFYPAWDGAHPIHLIGHSMGGQTARMVEFLLQKGYAEEVSAVYPPGEPPVSQLFNIANRPGGNNWIKSMHTIATPHNGSPLQTALGGSLVDIIKNLILALSNVGGLTGGMTDQVYDFGLKQFDVNFAQLPGESWTTYVNRIMAAPMWAANFTDLASRDMGPEYAYWIHQRTQLAYAGTYYFGHSTQKSSSVADPTGGYNQLPTISGNGVLYPTGAIIGAVSDSPVKCVTGITCNPATHSWCDNSPSSAPTTTDRPFCYGDSWENNDGLVPRRSGRGPEIGYAASAYTAPAPRSTSSITYACGFLWLSTCYTSNWAVAGKWYEMFHQRDHVSYFV